MLRRAAKAVPGAVWLKRRLFDLWLRGSVEVPVSRAADRGRPPARKAIPRPADFPDPPRFVLYRIIGNDLVPRHRKGQARANLPFILEHESDWPECEKWFVVNRIVDAEEEAAVIDILEKAGKPYLHIPFRLEEYRAMDWDIGGVPPRFLPTTGNFRKLRPDQQARIISRINRFKINYFTHNNGARNIALNHGRARGDWILPWDGNCFLADSAWQAIVSSLREAPDLPYWLVPMARIRDNPVLLQPGFQPHADEEPQIIFRRDASQCFDEDFIYGRRPKVELFWRLGVPGPWDEWGIEPWDLPCPDFAADAGAWSRTGWVARLASGRKQLDASAGASRSPTGATRALIRAQSSMGLLDQLDRRILSEGLQDRPVLSSADAPGAPASDIIDQALRIAESARTGDPGKEPLSALRSAMQYGFALAVASSAARGAAGHDPSRSGQWQAQAAEALEQLLATLPRPERSRFRRPGRKPAWTVPLPELVFATDSCRYLAAADARHAEWARRFDPWLASRLALPRPTSSSRDMMAAHLMERAAACHHLNELDGLRDTLRDARAWAAAGQPGEPLSLVAQAAVSLLDLIGRQAFGQDHWQPLQAEFAEGAPPPLEPGHPAPVTARTLEMLQDRRLRIPVPRA